MIYNFLALVSNANENCKSKWRLVKTTYIDECWMVQMSNSFTYFTVSLSFSSRDISTAISNLLQMTTVRWQHRSHSMQTYHSGKKNQRQHASRCGPIPTLTYLWWPPEGPTRARPHGAHTRVICLRRMTTVLPCSGSRLKKIADSSQNVTGRKR